MKKYLFLLALAVLALTACVDDIVDENLLADGKYTLTVNASKGPMSKALDLTESTLSASWTAGDKVKVYMGDTEIGELTAQSTGTSTKLTGDLTATPSGELTLKYLSPNYSSQTGTLAHIAANCDYATATVHVKSVSGKNVTLNESSASFTNQQAIVKFTLKRSDGSALPCNPEALRVSDGTNAIVMTDIPGSTYSNEKNGDGVLYVAMPGFSDKTVIVDAYCNEKLYSYTTKATVSFANSSYYAITVKMSPATNVDLARVISNLELQNENTVTGTLDVANYRVKISIAADATVTLSNATINGTHTVPCYWAGLECKATATIVLADGTTNTIRGFHNDHPGIYIPNGYTLTIQGTGRLDASSNGFGSGIGGGRYMGDCGNIVIESGIINATGGSYAAGIGSGYNTSCGDISISGGTVTAHGGEKAAGIGSGHMSSCGDISISGGIVTATGNAAGIGTGNGLDGEEGFMDPEFEFPMPGTPAEPSTCGTITISGGTIEANGGYYGAGIGTGFVGDCGNITITSGVTHVTATKGSEASQSIGTGNNGLNFVQDSYSITIEDPSKVTQN